MLSQTEPKIFRMVSVIGKDGLRLQEPDVLSKEKNNLALCWIAAWQGASPQGRNINEVVMGCQKVGQDPGSGKTSEA